MTQNLVAGTSGGTFGLVFVTVHAGPSLASTLADVLRVGAALAFVAMAVMLAALRRRAGDGRAVGSRPQRRSLRRDAPRRHAELGRPGPGPGR